MRVRLLIGTLIVTTATIVAFFIPAAITLSTAENEAQIVELQREAADAAARLGPHLHDEDGDRGNTDGSTDDGGPNRRDADTDAGPGEEHDFAVYDLAGALRVGRGPDTADDVVRQALAGSSATAVIGNERVVAVPLNGGGALRAAEPISEATARVRATIMRLGLIAMGVLAAAAGGAWLLAGRLTAPLGQLRRAATRLGRGDFTVTAPYTGLAEIDEVGHAINTSAKRIGTLVERERHLTADASHQIRTPLAGLRLTLEAELASPRDDPTLVLHEALGAIDRLEATATAITELARDPSPAEPFVVADIVAEAVNRWRAPLGRSGRTLDAVGDPTVQSTARTGAVDTILDVLLDNAQRHGLGVVEIRTESVDGAVRIDVIDNGACNHDDGALFDRYRSTGGTGIGLHLARTLAEAEGGRLRLARRSPTTFELQLPPG